MSTDIVGYLQNRIHQTRSALEGTQKKINELIAERDTFTADIAGYERSLAAELRHQGVETQPPGVQETLNELFAEEVNKTDFARQFIIKNAATGVTTADIFSAFEDAGIHVRKPYIYSILQRLRQSGIKERRGKYYPVVQQSAEGVPSVN